MISKGKLQHLLAHLLQSYFMSVKQLGYGRKFQVNLFIQYLLSFYCVPICQTLYCVFEVQNE